MFESIMNFFKKMTKKEEQTLKSKDAAKERLHLVLMQDRANVSADFLDLMKQEIIEVIKKYIDIDESAMDVRLTNKDNEDGSNGAPALYANIPILNIKDEVRQTAQVKKSGEKNTNIQKGKKQEIKTSNESKNAEKKSNENKNNTNNKDLKKESEADKTKEKTDNKKEQNTEAKKTEKTNEKKENKSYKKE